jgi:ubiquinone/menaquinone biosynthesis C-methylase UbiE
MGIYAKYILPRVIDFACGLKPNMRQREKVVPLASGKVLEVGVGSGLNLPFYDPSRITKLWGLEPSAEMRRLAADAVGSLPFEFEFIDLPGEEIPLDANSVDTVLVTYTLCTIPETEPALRGMARVLRPGGKLIFCEHGAAPDADVRRWQDRMDPIWKRMAGGCHLNRVIPELIRAGGFEIDALDTLYLPGWRPAAFNYWGTALPR